MKSRISNQTWKRTLKMIKPQMKPIMIITVLAILVDVCELIRPYLIKVLIDDYLTLGIYQKGMVTIGMIGAIYIGLVLIGNMINFISKTATNMMGENVVYSMRNKLYQYTQYANIPFHDKTSAGKLFVSMTSDVEDISVLFKDVVTNLIKDILLIICLVGVMLYLSIKLSILAFIIIPLIIIASLTITRANRRILDISKQVRARLNTFLAESIYGVKLIKVFNRQYEKQKECEGLTKEYYKTRIASSFYEGLLPGIMLILENLGIAIIIWACLNNWFGVTVGIGVVYIFVTYIKQIFEPINRVIENLETVQEALVSIDKIYDILEKTEYLENLEEGKILDKVEGKIEFKHVWFAYQAEDWILKDISFVIEPGQSIALVGKTGSGKTTITNLINRFYDIQKGEILLDGVNIKEINIRSLRKKIGIVLQDPFIFARTIRDNIRLNEPLSDEEVHYAIQMASASDFVENLENGLDEISNERGNSYSAGQKQLLAFARIFAHNPSIFILDEATANIDTETESLIQKSVDKLLQEKTSIFIAHRLSTIVNVDKIIVLDHGQIIEQGNHQELLQIENGYYNKLYHAYYTSLQ